jgi:hypothetical protein
VSSNDIKVRSIILAGVAGVSFWCLTAAWRAPAVDSRVSSGRFYPEAGVSFFWEQNAVVVRVDDREERVPYSQLSSSAFYQQAMARLPEGERPTDTHIRWSRVIRYWIPIVVIAWLVLFRLWLPLRPYVEGRPVR